MLINQDSESSRLDRRFAAQRRGGAAGASTFLPWGEGLISSGHSYFKDQRGRQGWAEGWVAPRDFELHAGLLVLKKIKINTVKTTHLLQFLVFRGTEAEACSVLKKINL